MNVAEPVSAEAARWIARRGMFLDYLNEQQPADSGHNKRVAAGLIRLMQEWARFESQPCCDYRDHESGVCACPQHHGSALHPLGVDQ